MRRAALFTMWRGMLGDFNVETLDQQSSIVMFVFFQFIVVVLMMNLIIAIMGDSYEMVKENETIEALHERAKVIVDMELLCETHCSLAPACLASWSVTLTIPLLLRADPRGFWFMAPHQYGRYLHILTPEGSGDAYGAPLPWEGITGRVKQETNRLMGVIERSNTAMNSRVDGMEAKLEAKLDNQQNQLQGVEAKLDNQQRQLQSIEQLLSALLDQKQ